jgi:hypothetical protein
MNATNTAICEAMQVALAQKEHGHDMFVAFYPHVEEVEIRLYVGGWENPMNGTCDREPDVKSRTYLSGSLAPENPAATIREVVARCIEAINAADLEVRGEDF